MARAWNTATVRAVREALATRTRLNMKPKPGATGRSARRAAVLVPLCNVAGKASLLYTVRSDKVGSHKGQVSFPGGHLEADETAEQAAVREATEELGAIAGDVELLGCWDDVVAITGTIVTPVVGMMKHDMEQTGDAWSKLVLSEDEVAEAFTLPLDHMADPTNTEWHTVRHPVHGETSLPRYKGGPADVWGLTAWMTYGIMSEVLMDALDQHPTSRL